jgi:hypothetical protein
MSETPIYDEVAILNPTFARIAIYLEEKDVRAAYSQEAFMATWLRQLAGDSHTATITRLDQIPPAKPFFTLNAANAALLMAAYPDGPEWDDWSG